jgi:hypothetical protein
MGEKESAPEYLDPLTTKRDIQGLAKGGCLHDQLKNTNWWHQCQDLLCAWPSLGQDASAFRAGLRLCFESVEPVAKMC